MFAITKLRCEYKENPLGIDVIRPRISWQLVSDDRDCMQSAYQIQVAENMLFQGKLWDTEEVKSSQSIHVELEGLLLEARTRYYYRVRAWNQNAIDSGWSEVAFFETGLLDAGNWQAEWISAPTASFSQDSEICPQLRTFVDVKGPVESARIYATALGLYELQLNGSRVGDHYFTPGWTSYSKRLQYQTYDVTKLLHEGANALGALLGNGWYRGYLGWDNQKEIYGSKTSLLLELHIRYADGSNELISSDQNWQAAKSAIMMSEIYNGETYDARLELDITDPSSEGWHPVEIINYSKAIIVAQENVPVTQVETLKPIALLTTPQGDRVLDMGQNIVGWLKFNVKGQSGQMVELQHAEILDRDGNFYTENMRKAKQCIRYTLKGGEQETYEPHFTFQGFRYVKLSGFSADLQLEDFTGIVMHSNMERTGDFQCSDPLVNQLHHNILWGQKGISSMCPLIVHSVMSGSAGRGMLRCLSEQPPI